MIKYILKRIVLLLPVLLAVAILIFTLMYFVPGDPALSLAGGKATEEELLEIRHSLGLDKGYFGRLFDFLGGIIFRGSFGRSYINGTSVVNDLLQRLPNTLTIAFFSMLICVLVGLPIGIRAAIKANTWEDRLSMFFSMIGVSIPNFWLGILLALLFSLKLRLFPSSGTGSWKNFVLPIMSCSLAGFAGMARLARSSMLEVIRSDFVTTARAKGVSEHNVIYKHALPNALIPIITSIGNSFGHSMGGTVVIETIFSVPGVGLYMVDSINRRDYNCVQGSIIVFALIFSLVMLVVDILYAVADPRIKVQYIAQGKKKTTEGKEREKA